MPCGSKIQPVDGYVAVYLVLTIDVNGMAHLEEINNISPMSYKDLMNS